MRKSATLVAVAVVAGTTATTATAQIAYYGTPVVAGSVSMAVTPVMPVIAAPVVAPSAPAVVYASPTTAAPGVISFYQVKQGGRLESVAKRTGVSLADLVRLNPLLDPRSKLPAGTLVGLPIP